VISTPELKLAEQIFSTYLIILSGQGIDVIPGMSWMKLHMAVLDIAAHLVHLNSPVYGKVALHLHMISGIKASMHHVVDKRLEEIYVVQEFPTNDLPGMPPERAIDFKIELQPGTAPITKSLYQMTLVKLAELKIQLKDLLDKGYIQTCSSSCGCPALFVKKKDEALHLSVDY
jgi:hypothetical protein